jgi:F420-dependent oxidoreductase-like protein
MAKLRYGLKLVPQAATMTDLRSAWQIADDGGFDHCWTNDHVASIGDSLDEDVYEGWMLLAAMAEATSRVRIGCLVTANTFRHPGILAKMATTVDHLSGGRLEFGLGAAWVEDEHTMLGIEFGSLRDRMDRYEEACRVIRRLWTEQTVSFDGDHYRLKDAVSNPKPVQQPHPPIWVGGKGRNRSLRIAAEYADVWNAANVEPDEFTELSAVLDEHCLALNRDPAEIRRTVQILVGHDLDELRRSTDAFAAAGATDVIYFITGDAALRRAEQLAAALHVK